MRRGFHSQGESENERVNSFSQISAGNVTLPPMDKSAKTFLFDLLNTPSPTGFELPGQRKWAAYVRQFSDRVENDAYGTAWATVNGRAKKPRRVMLEAHADEIGFIVKHITKEGWLRIDRIGGSDTATARGRRIHLLGDKGVVHGVIGNTAIHLRKDSLGEEKAPKIHELYVDVGASSAETVSELGLRVGHPAVYADAAEEFAKNRIVGRALDNRLGGFILTQVLANLHRAKKRPYDRDRCECGAGGNRRARGKNGSAPIAPRCLRRARCHPCHGNTRHRFRDARGSKARRRPKHYTRNVQSSASHPPADGLRGAFENANPA
jgi:hypothetical protein